MFQDTWKITRGAVEAFFEDRALSRGAAIAFYIMTAFAPVLYITAAVAGLVFGHEAISGALSSEIRHVIGPGGAQLVHAALSNTFNGKNGFWANLIGVVLVIVTASGVFGEMQSTLNDFWKAEPRFSVWELIRTRIVSLGLVLALGFLLMISLVINAAITALGTRIQYYVPLGPGFVWFANFIVSFALISVLFAAIYKVLPDVDLEWGDVIAGSIATAALFEAGEYLIGLYLSTAGLGSRYGAAGGLFVLLIWIYYTTQVFLLGAELTKVYSLRRGSQAHSARDVAGAPATAS
jgi:membrane protein